MSFLSTAVQEILEQGRSARSRPKRASPAAPPSPSVLAIGTHVAYVAGVALTDAVLATRES